MPKKPTPLKYYKPRHWKSYDLIPQAIIDKHLFYVQLPYKERGTLAFERSHAAVLDYLLELYPSQADEYGIHLETDPQARPLRRPPPPSTKPVTRYRLNDFGGPAGIEVSKVVFSPIKGNKWSCNAYEPMDKGTPRWDTGWNTIRKYAPYSTKADAYRDLARIHKGQAARLKKKLEEEIPTLICRTVDSYNASLAEQEQALKMARRYSKPPNYRVVGVSFVERGIHRVTLHGLKRGTKIEVEVTDDPYEYDSVECSTWRVDDEVYLDR